jgi:trans-feruloyl-CoA hydratase/vanillin synthase
MTEHSYNTIKIDKNDGTTTLTFNRPEQRNAMSPELHAEMVDALDVLAADDDTQVLVITGAGKAFCAGQDLKKYFHATEDDPAARLKARRDAHDWRQRRLHHFPKPTIAAVNGYTFGGAFTVVASCDIAIAANEAIFGLSEVNFGKIAGGMVSKIITDNMIPRQALFYVMTGRQFDGVKAREIGFVTESVPLADLYTTVYAIADELKQKDPLALKAVKEAMRSIDLRQISYDDSFHWLTAKSTELEAAQRAKTGRTNDIDKFMAKEFRPGFGSAAQQAEG